MVHVDDRVQPKIGLSRDPSYLRSRPPLRCHDGITRSDSWKIQKRKIASFRRLKPQKLAISKTLSLAKATPAQRSCSRPTKSRLSCIEASPRRRLMRDSGRQVRRRGADKVRTIAQRGLAIRNIQASLRARRPRRGRSRSRSRSRSPSPSPSPTPSPSPSPSPDLGHLVPDPAPDPRPGLTLGTPRIAGLSGDSLGTQPARLSGDDPRRPP
ncbi:hypothetical protein ACVMHR_009915 [Bradyrhizobium diazoefficiens]